MNIAIVGSVSGFMNDQEPAEGAAGILAARNALAGCRVAPGKLWQA